MWGWVPDARRTEVDERNAARRTGAADAGDAATEPEGYGFFADNWTVWSVGLRALLTPLALWVDATSWPAEIFSATRAAGRRAAKNEKH